MLQHFSKSSSTHPILQYPRLQHPSNVPASPKTLQHPPDKRFSVSVNVLASAQIVQHPQKAPASPQHQAVMPPPPGPHWAQLLVAFGAATTQLGRKGLGCPSQLGTGSGDTVTGGRENDPVPAPGAVQVRGRRRCRRGCCPGSGPDPAAGRRVRTSGRREEGQVQGKMPSSWKRPSGPRLGWNKPQHPSCATAAPGRGN